MIEGLKRRARKAGLLDRIDARTISPTSMQLADLGATVDCVFAFAVVHELPSATSFFSEAARAMKSGAELLLAEPAGHVSEAEFTEQTAAAAHNGLSVFGRPSINRCFGALLQKS
jgi:Methyltransferase domain